MREFFTTENTEGTERKPEKKEPERVSSVRSVFSVVRPFPEAGQDCDVRREGQPCS
jgi:hypothetical protein